MKNGPHRITIDLKRVLAIICVFLVTLTCITVSLFTIFSSLNESSLFFGGLSNMPLIYEKDDGIYINKIGEEYSYKLIDATCSKSQFSKDQKRIYLLCNNDLLYINFNEINYDDMLSSKTLIASDVDDFECSSDGRFAIFKKGHSLYYYKTNSKPKLLANNVFSDAYINGEDGNIIYTIYNSDLCVYNTTKDKTIRTKDISVYKFKNNNSEKLYFIKSGILYYKDKDETPEYITNNISGIISTNSGLFAISKIENTNSIYKINGTKISLVDNNVFEITEDFGTFLIYKKETERGYETRCLDKGGKTFELFDKNSSASNYTITNDGKYVFAIINYGHNPNVLVKYSLTPNGVTNREIIEDNVFEYSLIDNNAVVYSVEDGVFLYENNKSILLSKYNVSDIVCTEDSVYITESADGKNFNILRVKNGSVQFLAENTSGIYDALTSSAIAYLKDDELYFKHGTNEHNLINNNVKSLIKTTKYN